MRKTIIIAAFSLAALALATPAFAGKVGFVDLQRVLDLTTMGKDASKEIAAKADELTISGKKKELELRTMGDNYQKSEAALSDAAKQSKREELQKKASEFYQFQQQAGFEMENFKLERFKKVIAKVKEISTRLATSGGYDLVLLKVEDQATEGSVVLYGSSSVDLTDQIVRQMNQ
jgi:Skp family chaperone for outer membrane proteins